MWQIVVDVHRYSFRLIEYSSTKSVSLALSHRLMTGGGDEKKNVTWSWIDRDAEQMGWRSGNSSHASMQLIPLDTSHSLPPRAANTHTWQWSRGSEKGINKKLRDHIMEKHTNNNKHQPWEINTWKLRWIHSKTFSLFDALFARQKAKQSNINRIKVFAHCVRSY